MGGRRQRDVLRRDVDPGAAGALPLQDGDRVAGGPGGGCLPGQDGMLKLHIRDRDRNGRRRLQFRHRRTPFDLRRVTPHIRTRLETDIARGNGFREIDERDRVVSGHIRDQEEDHRIGEIGAGGELERPLQHPVGIVLPGHIGQSRDDPFLPEITPGPAAVSCPVLGIIVGGDVTVEDLVAGRAAIPPRSGHADPRPAQERTRRNRLLDPRGGADGVQRPHPVDGRHRDGCGVEAIVPGDGPGVSEVEMVGERRIRRVRILPLDLVDEGILDRREPEIHLSVDAVRESDLGRVGELHLRSGEVRTVKLDLRHVTAATPVERPPGDIRGRTVNSDIPEGLHGLGGGHLLVAPSVGAGGGDGVQGDRIGEIDRVRPLDQTSHQTVRIGRPRIETDTGDHHGRLQLESRPARFRDRLGGGIEKGLGVPVKRRRLGQRRIVIIRPVGTVDNDLAVPVPDGQIIQPFRRIHRRFRPRGNTRRHRKKIT